jgi:O-antigen ligase
VTVSAPHARADAGSAGARPDRSARLREWVRRDGPQALVLGLPAAGTVALAFASGGFFAGTVGTAAVLAAAALAVRLALAARPLEGVGPWALAGLVALAGFGVWTLASSLWSDAPARALVEADRVLLYLLTFALVAAVPRRPGAPAVLAGWLALALVVVCGAAFVSRALPEVLSTTPNINNDRLSYPLTYWNALGLAAALGLVLCLHVAAGARRALVQAAGAAATPVLAATLVLTFSRTSILVAAGAVGLYAVAGRPRGLAGALLVCAPAVAIAVGAALDADLLATADPTTPAAVDQGADLARVVAITMVAVFAARLLLTRLDDLVARALEARRARLVAWGAFGVAVIAAAGVALSAGAADTVRDKVDAFFENDVIPPGEPTRDRLTQATSNDRVVLWEAALDAFRADAATGHGAGTYRLIWDRERPEPTGVKPLNNVVDGHSLYLEVLAELGWPGLLALVTVLGLTAVALVRRARGPERAAWVALLAAFAAWAAHAGADWDWEMPAVTLFVFAIAGVALARPARGDVAATRPPLGLAARAPLVLGCALLAVVPWQIARSQQHLDDAVAALVQGDCARAGAAARDSIGALAVRPEGHEVLGICLARAGAHAASITELERAARRDPDNWEIRYELALVLAMAREDPRRQAALALRLNPWEPLAQLAVQRFDTDRRRLWRRRALSAPLPGLSARQPGSDAAVSTSAGGPAPAP